MAKTKSDKPEVCPECKGPRKGRGFTHADNCSEKKTKGASKPRTRTTGIPYIPGTLAGQIALVADLEESISKHPKDEVAKIRKAFADVKDLEKKLEAARAKLI